VKPKLPVAVADYEKSILWRSDRPGDTLFTLSLNQIFRKFISLATTATLTMLALQAVKLICKAKF